MRTSASPADECISSNVTVIGAGSTSSSCGGALSSLPLEGHCLSSLIIGLDFVTVLAVNKLCRIHVSIRGRLGRLVVDHHQK
mmetsp:Transcript_3574/g.8369  ORF Transcript_3574/g.8369 Transcript_3574/m.8369 type:complete len:82 (-) Transcript_3574:140-385(-)